MAISALSRPVDRTVGPVDPTTEIETTVVLRRRAEVPPEAFAGAPLSRTELAESYGADPAELQAVVDAVDAAGGSVLSADAATRLVRVRATADVLQALVGVELRRLPEDVPGSWVPGSDLTLASALDGPVTAVLGLDDRPQAEARYRLASAAAGAVSYTPLQLAKAYAFPEADGSGQTIAIIELGGGFGSTDLDTYFGGLKLATPSVTAVGVDGGENKPGQDPDGADGEVLLDIEVAGAIAPKASIVVYVAPNTDAGFVDAVTEAAHADPTPAAISISWGGSEDTWAAQSRTALDQAIADAALLGVTVTVAAGDNGSSDTAPAGSSAAAPRVADVHCDFPASSPHALGCGGTSLTLATDGSVATETVWNDGGTGGSTGGGVSDVFAQPAWQQGVGVPARAGGSGSGRGVPDVAGVADPQTGYQVVVDGKSAVIGGTSAVAPLWAGLIARLVQLGGKKLGLLDTTLYSGMTAGSAAAGFRDITSGSNGAYEAAAGWDACTGLGVPDGTALLARLKG